MILLTPCHINNTHARSHLSHIVKVCFFLEKKEERKCTILIFIPPDLFVFLIPLKISKNKMMTITSIHKYKYSVKVL